MTTTSRQAESSANKALGDLLQDMMRGATVRYENTQVIEGHPGLRPDIIITDNQRSPVVVEAEYMPARSVEREAVDRLGLAVVGDTRVVEAAIALRYPADIADASDLDGAIREARLEYAVLYKDKPRFPASGWISGAPSDLSDLIRLVSMSESAVEAAVKTLEKGIDRAVAVMDEMDKLRPTITPVIARLLGMTDPAATRRMACAIIANALIFHERIVGMHPDSDVQPLNLLWGSAADNPRSKISAAWDAILENINYWAIFAIARDIVNQLSAHDAAQILERLRDTAESVNAGGAIFAHNLTGRIFQRLISDREYLATYYTSPESAALLARIAVSKLEGVDWANAKAIGKLRVADFACGTGALLSAVYEQFANRHERAGGNAAALHKPMIEDVLYGCDVMPSAIHITGATLSGIQPNVGYENSRLYTMPYGRQRDGIVKIGSLELMQSSSAMALFNTNEPARRTGSRGEETASHLIIDIPDAGFDIVIMNPPFTRNTTNEGEHSGEFNSAFAAFNTSDEAQRAMSRRMANLREGTCYHGNAGIASAFAAIGDRKLKPGGVFAFVLPLSAATGVSWQKFRDMLSEGYTDFSILSIAANGTDMAFSSDTGIAECLFVARKRRNGEAKERKGSFISLRQRPGGFAQSYVIANSIVEQDDVRGIEQGAYGGGSIFVGDEVSGQISSATFPYGKSQTKFNLVRILDNTVAQTAFALSQSKLSLPGKPAFSEIRMAALGDIGKLGLHHRDIEGPPPRGPFTISKTLTTPQPTYPALWNHNAKKETRMLCEYDAELIIRDGMEEKAGAVWATASRAHLNAEFTCSSQALAIAFTERETIGGSSWPNVIFSKNEYDYAFSVWCNSTLGLVSHWWHSSRQQSSKIRMTIRSSESLPTLDLRALSDAQLATAQEIFDEFRELELQPAYLADADANRALLDRRVVRDMLGFDDAVYEGVRMLAAKWCAEPSVHGGKRRPAGARLVA